MEALRRVKARGVETSLVVTGRTREQIAFYESAGFRLVNRRRSYVKPVNAS